MWYTLGHNFWPIQMKFGRCVFVYLGTIGYFVDEKTDWEIAK